MSWESKLLRMLGVFFSLMLSSMSLTARAQSCSSCDPVDIAIAQYDLERRALNQEFTQRKKVLYAKKVFWSRARDRYNSAIKEQRAEWARYDWNIPGLYYAEKFVKWGGETGFFKAIPGNVREIACRWGITRDRQLMKAAAERAQQRAAESAKDQLVQDIRKNGAELVQANVLIKFAGDSYSRWRGEPDQEIFTSPAAPYVRMVPFGIGQAHDLGWDLGTRIAKWNEARDSMLNNIESLESSIEMATNQLMLAHEGLGRLGVEISERQRILDKNISELLTHLVPCPTIPEMLNNSSGAWRPPDDIFLLPPMQTRDPRKLPDTRKAPELPPLL